jgi:hypothetical protein
MTHGRARRVAPAGVLPYSTHISATYCNNCFSQGECNVATGTVKWFNADLDLFSPIRAAKTCLCTSRPWNEPA